MCVCVCANAYLNIPHPKLCKPCLYKSERGKEREGEREAEIWQGTGQKERRGGGGREGGEKEERKISLLRSCCHGNPPDNTYSLCHSGMKESDELTPPFIPLMKKHTRHVKTTLAFPPLLFPVGALSLYLKERRNTQSVQIETRWILLNQNKSLVAHELNSKLHYPLSQSAILTPPTVIILSSGVFC